MLQINETSFKTIGKNISKNIKDTYGKGLLSLAESYELLAKAMGYKDYNAMKSLVFKNNEKQSKKTGEKVDFDFLKGMNIREVFANHKADMLQKYPSIDNLFVPYKGVNSNKYDTFIHKEISGNGEQFYLLVRLKDSPITNRVFYSPEYESFSLFVYPNIQETYNDYHFDIRDIETKNLDSEFFSTIKHLNNKTWMDKYLLDDLMDIMVSIKKDRFILNETISKISKDELEKLYLLEKEDVDY